MAGRKTCEREFKVIFEILKSKISNPLLDYYIFQLDVSDIYISLIKRKC